MYIIFRIVKYGNTLIWQSNDEYKRVTMFFPMQFQHITLVTEKEWIPIIQHFSLIGYVY